MKEAQLLQQSNLLLSKECKQLFSITPFSQAEREKIFCTVKVPKYLKTNYIIFHTAQDSGSRYTSV